MQLLSLTTAVYLFNAKILPILTYGIHLIWEKLTKKDLATIEGVKAKFLKAAMGISKYTRSCLMYELARENFLIEELRTKLLLPSTKSGEEHLEDRRKKREEIPLEFYGTDGMIYHNWANANQRLRHVVIKLAVHGYHHKICNNTSYHDPSENCMCSLCGLICDIYHITKCKENHKSLSDYCKD